MNLREWALPVYTILVQLSYGALLTLWLLRTFTSVNIDRGLINTSINNSLLIIFITIVVGMIGSHFHLSQPYLSSLALLNLSRSWLSREILFNLLFFLTTGWLLFLQIKEPAAWRLKIGLGWLAILFGTGNIFCMAHIYLLPTQSAWNTWLTIFSFFSTALLLGVTALVSILFMDLRYSEMRKLPDAKARANLLENSLNWFALSASLLGALVMAENLAQIYLLRHNAIATSQMSLQLLVQLYPALFVMRLASLILGVSGLVAAVFWRSNRHKPVSELLVPGYITFLLIIVGEILGRFLFYATHVRLGL
jgi:anaerobic dimethyl sulfoxide reductase subunit C (anchor subunit)